MELDYSNPHQHFGFLEEEKRFRFPAPHLNSLSIDVDGEIILASKISDGIFELDVEMKPEKHRVDFGLGFVEDPYQFTQLATEQESALFYEGRHPNLYDFLGGRLASIDGVKGARFVVWAPNALKVSVIGDFNQWQKGVHYLRKVEYGIWELFVPGLKEGDSYQFVISNQNDQIKADPFAQQSEGQKSILADPRNFAWEDDLFLQTPLNLNGPINIYEVHLGTWKKEFQNYRELADQLVQYCKEHHYQWIEILPIHEYPYNGSWGYQVSGLISATSRYGNLHEFQYLVNTLHQHNIRIILDFVMGHFPKDEFALKEFDGTPLFESSDPFKKEQPKWSTLVFDYNSPRVQNFLTSAALYWLDLMHVDGLRIDAVDSMVHLDFGKNKEQWEPNELGGREHLEAIAFLKRFTKEIKMRFPNRILFAEDSSGFKKVTHPIEQEGLGFDLKWNLGFIFDTLKFMEEEKDHNWLYLTMSYHYQDRFVLPFSHDELATKSLYEHCKGTEEQKWAKVRLLLSFFYTHPGKKLLFMGYELGQKQSWNGFDPIDWSNTNTKLHKMTQTLNALYQKLPAFWNADFEKEGFSWGFQNGAFFSFYRSNDLYCIHNFTNQAREVEAPVGFEMIFDSNAKEFGGNGGDIIAPWSSRIFMRNNL